MKNLITTLVILCFTIQSFGSEKVLLISPLVKLGERDLPKQLDKDYVTYSQFYLESTPKSRNIENLLNEFENAQKYYLVKSLDLARQYYEKVVAMSDIDEWKDIHRKIIYISYIRLSELNRQNQKDWIQQALNFSMEIDPKKLDIGPESLKAILDLKKNLLKQSIDWQVAPLRNEFTYILVNGHVVDLRKIETIKIPAGKFRVTFLSDIYKPQTYQVSSQQIPLIIPTRIPFVSGSCEKPFYNNEGETSSEIALYYSKNCIKNQQGKKWVAENDGPALEPVVKYNELNTRIEHDEPPFYKKKWFIVTAGLLAAAVAIHAVKRDEKEKPTHETVNGF